MRESEGECCRNCRWWYRAPSRPLPEALQLVESIEAEIGRLEAQDAAEGAVDPSLSEKIMQQLDYRERLLRGECRRYPPAAVYWPDTLHDDPQGDRCWPPTRCDEWCGEWQAG